MNLRAQLFIPTVFLLLSSSALIHYFWLPLYVDTRIQQQHEDETAYIKLLGSTLISDILSNDLAKVASTLDRVTQSRDYWRYVTLYKNNGKRIYPLFEKHITGNLSLNTLTHNIVFKDKKIATITIWMNLTETSTEDIKLLKYLEQILLSLLLGVALIVIVVQDRWIRRPIDELSYYANEIASGNYDQELIHAKDDEIGKLAKSFNSMRQQIKAREGQLLDYSRMLETLHNITSNAELSFDQKIDSLLKLGKEVFNLPLAILSHVVDDRYIIKNIAGSSDAPPPGTEFALGETYCSITLNANGPTGFHHTSKSAYKEHPCYSNFGLESYLGTPINVNGEIYGTLNFSGPDAREKPFSSTEFTILKLFAQWISTELASQQAKSELEKLSRTDGLTGVANRRQFDESLAKEINRAVRNVTPTSLIICDVDYFKNYNDTYGHKAGDACLKQIAEILSSCFTRTGELVARYGGEEFAIIIPNVGPEDALKQAEKMLDAVKNAQIKHESSKVSDSVTISAGLVTVQADQSITSESIIQCADAALYEAKNKGRNNVKVYRTEP